MDAETLASPLFLEKSFLKPRKQNLRGVELFSLGLLGELAQLGVCAEVPAHKSWRSDFESLASTGIGLRPMPLGGSFMNGLCAVRLVRRGERRKIIVGNVANGLIPALCCLRLCRSPLQLVVFAHRMPSLRFMTALPKKGTRILAVNGIIAEAFRRAGFEAETCFGHINPGRFHPGDKTVGPSSQRKVNFCVIGFLDNAWKGADTALAAFRALPPDVAANCCLHLASYRSPPSFPESNVRTYAWFPDAEMPDFLRRMDVMIVPSRDENVMRETFSLAMVEGMLTGLPVLASNLPVLAEKLDAGGGCTFADSAGLSRLMAAMASDPGKRAAMGLSARRTAIERYVWSTEKFVSRWLA